MPPPLAVLGGIAGGLARYGLRVTGSQLGSAISAAETRALSGVQSRFLGGGLKGRIIADAISEEAFEEGAEPEEIVIPVSSTAIRAIGWRTGDIITVDFHRGGSYEYEGSKELFMAFAASPSKGTFFNQHFQVRR